MNTEQDTLADAQQYVIVGVVGHIDHGKTSLVARLTGVDTDTHPEEKRRGITIDLGFAVLPGVGQTLAFVDAPGHQKYIGNLLAGVSAVDVGLLVVAADQGIQAQTLEHVTVLHRLRVSHLVVALSRIDLCDAERRSSVREELEFFLADYGFSHFPIVEVSSVTGEGLDALKQALFDSVRHHGSENPRERAGELAAQPFRMPIDRVISVEGRGLVLAGTPWFGTATVGDTLLLSDGQTHVRVRDIESHGIERDQSRVRTRTAINVSILDSKSTRKVAVKRGDELLAPEAYSTSSRVLLDLQLEAEVGDLKCPCTVQLHTASTSVSARLLGVRVLRQGQQEIVLAEFDSPVVTTYGQPCLIRRAYPVGTLGGGQILASCDVDLLNRRRNAKELVELGKQLIAAEDASRLVAWVEFLGECTVEPRLFANQLGIQTNQLPKTLEQIKADELLICIGDRLISESHVNRIQHFLLKQLRERAESEDDAWIIRSSLVEKTTALGSIDAVELALDRLLAKGHDGQAAVVQVNNMLAIHSEETALSKKQLRELESLLAALSGERMPPNNRELADQLNLKVAAVNSLLRYATQQRTLVEVAKGLFFDRKVVQQLITELASFLEKSGEARATEIKEMWSITRKHAIPLLEYFDAQAITVRQTDTRQAGPRMQKGCDNENLEPDRNLN